VRLKHYTMGDFYYWAPSPKLSLPTCDINSLHALTYIKLSGADTVNLHPTFQSFKHPGKVLGRLHTPDNKDILKSQDIVKHLKQHGFDLDAGFAGDEVVSDIAPFTALIEEKLLPAVLYTLWMDTDNYSAVTHQLYAKSCRLPMNFVVPVRMQKRHEEFLRTLKFWDKEAPIDDKIINTALITPACSVLGALSEYLDAKEWFLGDKPSSLDALLFALLAPLLKLNKLSTSKLRSELKKNVNTCQYIDRILKNNFKNELEGASTTDVSSDDGVAPSDCDQLFDWKYDVMLPVSVAGIVMASYAINVFVIAPN